MKIASPCRSAFVTPRVLASLGFGAAGVLLGLIAFFALPKHSALARPQCGEVQFEDHQYSYNGTVYVEMTSDTDAPYIIFYRIGNSPPANPTHNGDTPTGGTFAISPGTMVSVLPGQHKWIKAIAYKSPGYPWADSVPTVHEVDNTIQ